MKILIATGAVLVATFGLTAGAFAQKKAPVYRYCLLESSGGWRGGGGSTLCRFNTIEQCMASKTGWSDSCIINPELTFPPRR
jgi:hypothetical protein